MKGYHYTDSGLRNVWLANGYEVVPSKYGEGIMIHDLAGLHRAIGLALCQKSHLTGTEFRFLRKEMEMSQRGLGELIGVTDQAVAKWEKYGNVPKTADRMIRLIYLDKMGGNVRIQETIERINHTDRQQYEQIIAETEAGTWKLAA
jgi:DNA-binding transcriptional regulator YiaG